MSAKYLRVKQADLDLPAPLRWLTRAFSTITMAVVLLSMVVVYGLIASVPVFLLMVGGLYAAAVLGTVGVAVVLIVLLNKFARGVPVATRAAASVLLLGAASAGAYVAWMGVYHWAQATDFMAAHRATVIYRLPFFEMTEGEFYAWWPFRLILILFVVNMIWATVRRIEFKFVNIGVLTVHAGIVVLALGSILYSHFKVEGDTILWRRDLGGPFESVFYAVKEPALYVRVDGTERLMMPLPTLPRYNDYALGELDIKLHEVPGFSDALPNVRMTIPGFLAWAELQPVWRDLSEMDEDDAASAVDASPAVRLSLGDDGGDHTGHNHGPGEHHAATLLADVPAQRVVDQPIWALEYLVAPTEARKQDLLSAFDGAHGLVVEVPDQNFRAVYAIEPGKVIEVGDTGYTLTVNTLGPYGMAFATEGYRGATDTQAVVHVQGPDKDFTRIALHRYPERSQDFVPAPDDPSVGPMGRRTDPDPAIRLTYLDTTKPQYHLIAADAGAELELIVRLPNLKPMWTRLPDGRIPVPSGHGGTHLVEVIERIAQAVRVVEPQVVPKLSRDPKDEGTYIHSLLPLRIEVDLPESEGGGTWQRLVWMPHMRYPKYPDQTHRPVFVDVPGVGQVELAFSRVRHQLPFAIALDEFEMQPYEGSTIPRDFVAQLRIADLNEQGLIVGQAEEVVAHMNNPVVYRAPGAPLAMGKVKISQAGWDPPNPQDPMGDARDEQGRFTNQQRFTVLGIGNNVGIRIIFLGAALVVIGIPWAFYIKPLLVQMKKRKIQEELARSRTTTPPTVPAKPGAAPSAA